MKGTTVLRSIARRRNISLSAVRMPPCSAALTLRTATRQALLAGNGAASSLCLASRPFLVSSALQSRAYSSAHDHASTPVSKTVFYDLHVEHGAKMVPFAAFSMPLIYKDLSHAESHKWTREKASLFDVGHMVQHSLSGPLAETLLKRLTPGSISSLAPNSSTLSTFLLPSGGIVDDTIITRLTPDSFYIVTNAGCRDKDLAYLRSEISKLLAEHPEAGPDAIKWSIIKDRALLALQGPLAQAALQPLLPSTTDLSTLYFSHCLRTKLSLPGSPASEEEIQVSRTGYTGEDGFEISIPTPLALPLAKALLAQPSVKLAGLAARDSLRLEAGMCLYGNDIDESRTPVEASLAWLVGRDRQLDSDPVPFYGKEKIVAQMPKGSSPAAIRRVGLTVEGAPARPGAKIGIAKASVPEGSVPTDAEIEEVGVVTSGGPSVSLAGTNVAMGYVRSGSHARRTPVWVNVRRRWRRATVVGLPFVRCKYHREPKSKA